METKATNQSSMTKTLLYLIPMFIIIVLLSFLIMRNFQKNQDDAQHMAPGDGKPVIREFKGTLPDGTRPEGLKQGENRIFIPKQ